eukprot:TRINITY_DN1446_c0_g1_i5.p1 TRINITY_DN1446_c0_g1~~TRINITY_DN1446_c0_g1_i5.p1  ORF type:complete len:390 (-),score=93.50 TRINITY_DN1446_c0_g1_i5:12-1181(-)
MSAHWPFQAVGMLLDGSFVHDAMNGDDDDDKGKGIDENGWGGEYEPPVPPGGCSDDFMLALQMQKEWMEEEQARKAVECKLADKDIFECIICMDDCCTAEEMYNVEECGHAFCKDCMREYVKVQIHQRESLSAKDIIAQQQKAMAVSPDEEVHGGPGGESDQDSQSIDLYFRIKCPHTTCNHFLDYFELRQCVDAGQLALLDQITLNRVHSFVPTLQWCIGCGSTVVVQDKGSKFVQCDNPVCKLTYCIVCREAHKDRYTCAHFQAHKRKRAQLGGNQKDKNRDKIKHPKYAASTAAGSSNSSSTTNGHSATDDQPAATPSTTKTPSTAPTPDTNATTPTPTPTTAATMHNGTNGATNNCSNNKTNSSTTPKEEEEEAAASATTTASSN